jgi:hypothetical protein
MCTYYYLHHHHTEACGRAIDIVVHYVFCPAASASATHTHGNESFISTSTSGTWDNHDITATSSTTTSGGLISQSASRQLTLVPCGNLYFDPSQSVDYNNPCATGGCLPSPDCTSGACRLLQLNGHWKCCRCQRGGNRYRWCRHRMRQIPDTFCYHVCCMGCVPDDAADTERV